MPAFSTLSRFGPCDDCSEVNYLYRSLAMESVARRLSGRVFQSESGLVQSGSIAGLGSVSTGLGSVSTGVWRREPAGLV